MNIYDIDGNPIPVSTNDEIGEPAITDIPKIFFTGTLPTSKDDGDVSVKVQYYSKTDSFSCYGTLKVQGNSSASFPKKNFTLKLYSDSAHNTKLKKNFRNWGRESKFVLKANWIDIQHCRNIVGARIWTQLSETRKNTLPPLLQEAPRLGAVDGFPVKVYANGVYQGRYTFNIPKDKWTFNMDDDLDEHTVLCGESNAIGSASLFDASSDSIDGTYWSDEIHDTVPASVVAAWTRVLKFVHESSDSDFKNHLGEYMNVASLIDYWIFTICLGSEDSYGKNQLYVTYDLTNWYISAYDMDQFCGLEWHGQLIVTPTSSYLIQIAKENVLFVKLIRNFGTEISARYAELRQSILSIGNIIRMFEQFTDICPPELVAEDYASTTANGAFTSIPTKDDENNIQQIREWMIERLAYCDTTVPNFGVEV